MLTFFSPSRVIFFFLPISFVLNLILKRVRSEGEIALATAYSGIAATMLQGGRTIHSRQVTLFGGRVPKTWLTSHPPPF